MGPDAQAPQRPDARIGEGGRAGIGAVPAPREDAGVEPGVAQGERAEPTGHAAADDEDLCIA